MATISLCMIVKNEEAVLARCLESVGEVADEIVILDTGSTDRTKEIAGRYTSRVYDYPWQEDFAAARNASFSKATMDYILWLDADDVLPEETRQGLLQWKGTLCADVVMLRYHVAFDAAGRPTFSYYRERLLRRANGYRWEGAVHEAISVWGKVVYSQLAVEHRKLRPGEPGRNLRIFERLVGEGKPLDPRMRFYYARELRYAGRLQEAQAGFEAFLREPGGWVENKIDACSQLSACRLQQGDWLGALEALAQSFCYDLPRAEICCEMGRLYFDRQDWKRAAFWYQLAASRPRDDRTGGFVQPDCYDFLPYLQLCVCYDRLGDWEQAREYHRRAARLKPQDPAVLHNEAYFQKEK